MEDFIPELHKPVEIKDITSAKHFEITADKQERKNLAKRFGIISIEKLKAELDVEPVKTGVSYKVTGTLEASVTQSCVVTLEPVKEKIKENFETIFSTEAKVYEGDEEFDLPEDFFETEEEPEPIIDGIIDLGEEVAEQLALSLNPFPKKENAVFDYKDTKVSDIEGKDNPFAVLEELKNK